MLKFLSGALALVLLAFAGPVLAAGSCQDMVIPAYVYPSSGGTSAPWSTLIGKTGAVYNSPLTSGQSRWVIMSPDVTSTATYNSDWGTVIQAMHDRTLTPAGSFAAVYIDLNYGAETEATVKGKIDKAVALYFGTGGGSKLYFDAIFFDRAPGTAGTYTGTTPSTYGAYLTDIITYAKNSQFGTGDDYWLNVGYWPDEAVMNLVSGVETDITVENDYSTWHGTDVPNVPAWVANYEGYRIGSIVHDSTSAQMTTGTNSANGINSGTVFFTDNAYTTGLPSYWSTELTQVNGGC
jgi:Spherulation-specific family 4